MNMEVKESYGHLRRWIMDSDPEEKLTGLKQCLMPSGKVVWLCEEHQNQPRITLVTGSVAGGYTRPQAEEKSEIVKALAKINSRSISVFLSIDFTMIIALFFLFLSSC